MLIILSISFLILILYIVCSIYKIKIIPETLSDTYYLLKNKNLFGLCLIISSCLLMPVLFEFLNSNYEFLGFLICIGLIGVGVSPNFKEDIERKIHLISASISFISSQILIYLYNPFYLLIWIPIVLYCILMKNKNYIFICEIFAILLTYLILYIKII